jgi:putative nucleotidyltransferase with HDIG domain
MDDSQNGVSAKNGVLALSANSHPDNRPRPELIENERIKSQMDSLYNHPQIDRIFRLLWEKDPDTYRHCHRVADMSQAIGLSLGLSYTERSEIYLCGLLHDIGKLFTPDSVLKKPGPLNAEEFQIMKQHPVDSGKLVSTFKDIGYLAEAIRSHHERIDGKGYPDNLQSSSIPLFSRIVLVADTFDAMTNNRVYRKQLDLAKTYDELLRCSGTQFDPEVAKKFINLHQKLVEGEHPELKIKKAA